MGTKLVLKVDNTIKLSFFSILLPILPDQGSALTIRIRIQESQSGSRPGYGTLLTRHFLSLRVTWRAPSYSFKSWKQQAQGHEFEAHKDTRIRQPNFLDMYQTFYPPNISSAASIGMELYRFNCRARLFGSRLGLLCKNTFLGSESVSAISSCRMWTRTCTPIIRGYSGPVSAW